jgi:hypothetical protein
MPSHEKWRAEHVPTKAFRDPTESEHAAKHVNDMSSRCGIYSCNVPDEAMKKITGLDDVYVKYAEPFAAELVLTTMDACVDMVEMWYDMVVFEEAGQVDAIKILKVLDKVFHARAGKGEPCIILSGDHRQLPPFSRERESTVDIFQCILEQAKQTRIPLIILDVQYRMNDAIARFVNSLFYSDQEWSYAGGYQGKGVCWIDTSKHMKPEDIQQRGTSKTNACEVRMLKDLIKQHDGGKVLIVSPYKAQVEEVERELRRCPALFEKIQAVSTVDACQGVEADCVIVSFVSLNFYFERDFVVDPRRLNVCISRACKTLYLVGSLTELQASLNQSGIREAYPHIDKLQKMVMDKSFIIKNQERCE